MEPRTRAWDGDRELVVITATGRGPPNARTCAPGRRPSGSPNSVRVCGCVPPIWSAACPPFSTRWPNTVRPARELAARLWPLDTWSGTARALLGHVDRAARPAERLTAFAAVVRHLLADPVLLPAGWPGDALRSAYGEYRREPTGEVRSRVGGA
ncbi:hypothetical protein RKD28_006342 [Streptomyces sp. SAI-229]